MRYNGFKIKSRFPKQQLTKEFHMMNELSAPKKVIESVKQSLEAKPYQTMLLPLDSNRKLLLELISADNQEPDTDVLLPLLTHRDFVVAEAAFNILIAHPHLISRLDEKTYTVLSQLVHHPDLHRRLNVALLLQQSDLTALPLIKIMIRDKSNRVRRASVFALSNKSFAVVKPILDDMWRVESDDDLLRTIVNTIHSYYSEPEARQFLETAALSTYKRTSNEAKSLLLYEKIRSAANPLEVVYTYLSEATVDSKNVVITALAQLGKQALPILEVLEQSPHKVIASLVKVEWAMSGKNQGENVDTNTLTRENELLWGIKPLFATTSPENLISLLNALNEAIGEINKRHPGKLIGIVLYGSTAEGYRKDDSDVDLALVVNDNEAVKDINDELRLKLGSKWHIDPFSQVVVADSKNRTDTKGAQYIFQGVFLGDRQALTQIQKATLESMSPEQWDSARRGINDMMAGPHTVGRLRDRQAIRTNAGTIEQARTLIRVPYDYETTLGQLKKRGL